MGMGKKSSPAPAEPKPVTTEVNEGVPDAPQKRGIPIADGGPVAAKSLLAQDDDNPRKRQAGAGGGSMLY